MRHTDEAGDRGPAFEVTTRTMGRHQHQIRSYWRGRLTEHQRIAGSEDDEGAGRQVRLKLRQDFAPTVIRNQQDVARDQLAAQPDRALVNVAQPDESRILMAPLAIEGGGWGQIAGWKSKDDPGYKEMARLVDSCIVKGSNDNTNGWLPTVEQGGGEKWVIDERKKYKANVGNR